MPHHYASYSSNQALVTKLVIICGLLLGPLYGYSQNLPQVKVHPKQIIGKRASHEEKMKRALSIFESVLNEPTFKEELLGMKFYSDVEEDPHRNFSTKQIAEKLYAAKEHYTSESDHQVDIYWIIKKRNTFVKLFKGCSVVGFGDEDEREIYTYSCFLDDKDTEMSDIVGHVAHEWTHKLGFEHEFDNHPRRNETVPYAFGILVSKYAAKHDHQP